MAAVLNFGLVWWLLGAYGLTGAAVGILAAEVLGSIGRWGAFLALVPDPARPVNQDHKGAPAMPPTARAARAADAAPGIVDDGAGHMLRSVVDLLDRQGIAYCIPHGYAAYPDRIGSDVDCIVDPRVSARRIQTLLQRKGPGFGALVVRCRGRHIVLAGRNSDGSRCYLTLDIDVDSGFGGVTFFTGEEMLADRRRFGAFCIPAPAKEFGAYIARCVARERLDADRTGRLEALFRQDPPGCRNQLHGLWAQGAADLILDALASSDWAAVAAHLPVLRRQLHTRSAKRFPIRSMLAKLQRVTARAARLLRPDGLSVVVLGPDGAGKSSTTEAIGGADLVPAFDRSVCQGFVPPLHRLIGRNHGPSKEPHALPSRSLPHSMLRWAYWLGYSYADQLRVHLAIARGTLVLYDRHLVDVLVDQKRYRYSGPMWPMRLLWTLVPKPDLVVVLDAPAEVIQARKQEVPFAETARQRDAYLTLVRSLGYGYAIDASRPFDQVTGQLNDIILKVLEARIARRLGRRASGVGNRCAAILAAPPASR